MTKKSPISVDKIQFCDYYLDQVNDLSSMDKFHYDDRRDFINHEFLAGIAVKVEISNIRYDKGARREVSFRLIDMTSRCQAAILRKRINLAKEDFKEDFVHFPAESSGLKGGHTYKLVVSDENVSQTLAEEFIHVYDYPLRQYYNVCDCGVHPAWEDNLYKSLNTIDDHDYYLRFNLTTKTPSIHPTIMPEPELRLHYPDGKYVKTFFKEPRCFGLENFNNDIWSVEFPFTTFGDFNGVFYAELLCMNLPIAGFVFDTMSGTDIKGKCDPEYIIPLDEYSPEAAIKRIDNYLPHRNEPESEFDDDDFDKVLDKFIASELENSTDDVEESIEYDNEDTTTNEEKSEPLVSLDHLTGIKSVKEKLALYERVVRFNKMRADNGLPYVKAPLHAMFLGSPGTGKTTVAKLMGKMLRRAGVLSRGHVVIKERATLLGQNYNSESEKTLKALEEAQGGILFIDEAYQLYQGDDPRDPGKFVIETLMTALADESNRDWMLILAGYPDNMMKMLNMNPGFKSRIPDSNIYVFDDYTEQELMEIAENYLTSNHYSLSDEARSALAKRVNIDHLHRDKNFGNARYIINMIQTDILPAMARRVTSAETFDCKTLTEILPCDIPSRDTTPARHSESRQRIGFTI